MARPVRRGEIRTAAGGVYASKPRPVVIVQDDSFDDTDSVAVCPLTSNTTDTPLLRISVEPGEGTGLLQPSFIQVEKVTTIRRSQMGDHLGELSRKQMVQLGRSLVVFLGIAN